MADEESPMEVLPYPKGTYFMTLYIFFERFSYYGIVAILIMYLKQSLEYSDDTSTFVFHTFIMLATFTPVLGGIISDVYVGKYRMIFYFSLLYASGGVILAVSSAMTSITLVRIITISALLITAISYGLCKPNFVAFVGDQFVLPIQKHEMEKYFSQIYISVNIASLLAMATAPSLRQDIECQGRTTCFPIPFGLFGAFLLFATLLFRIGLRFYALKPAQGTILIKVWNCIWYALFRRIFRKGKRRDYWLLYADDKYDDNLIKDTKTVLHVLYMFTPMPIYWALWMQMHSRWIIQASNMNGDLGFYMLKPDHMAVLNPLLVLILVPLFDKLIYPSFQKFRLCTRALQKMTIGGFVSASAFILSGLLELSIEESYPLVVAQQEAHLRIFNGYDCPTTLRLENLPSQNVNSLSMWMTIDLHVSNSDKLQASVQLDSSCAPMRQSTWNGSITIIEQKAISYFITYNDDGTEVRVMKASSGDDLSKSMNGKARLRLLYKFLNSKEPTRVQLVDGKGVNVVNSDLSSAKIEGIWEIHHGRYKVLVNSTKVIDIQLDVGGVYTLLVQEKSKAGNFGSEIFTITASNNMHMLWQIPQIFIITLGEIMVNIPAMGFSYTQAPKAMKTVIQAAWLLCTSLGNLIIMIVTELDLFRKQSHEFFMFSSLLALDMLIFMILSMRYKYVVHQDDINEETATSEN